jgi:hypothetical protein
MEKVKVLFGERTVLRIALAACLVVLAVLAFRRFAGPQNPYSFDRLTQDVTLICRETGEEFIMPRGRMEQQLWQRPAPIDPTLGLTNPNTGRPTLFPKNEWEATIDRINADRQAVADASGRKPRKGKE